MTAAGEATNTPAIVPHFTTIDEVQTKLADQGYLASRPVAISTFLADQLGKPLLIEGPAGVGKTDLAKSCALSSDARFIRLQCYEGIDEARALYEWNHAKQILRIQSVGGSWDDVHTDVFSDEFLLTRPLVEAITGDEPTVLLIDEIDKADVEFEGLLLELLSEFAVTIPELGTLRARRRPLVFLTSNGTRELSEALKRRCLYLHIDYPTTDLELQIIHNRVPRLNTDIANQLLDIVATLRKLDLKKPPSVSETLDFARTILALDAGLDTTVVDQSLGVLLKHYKDIEIAREELRRAP